MSDIGASHGLGESTRPAPGNIQNHVAPTTIVASHEWTGEAACVPYRSILPLHIFALFNKGPFSMLLCLPNAPGFLHVRVQSFRVVLLSSCQ
ncbi:hypothetical protein VTN77DRAFT_3282 [Rasamsonia byssochlamydoides]|uniref:uncharacterized protein n=1 Tax=Rasamsonia byssochlamydoides TaxID=89139 RepID=UPI0037448188